MLDPIKNTLSIDIESLPLADPQRIEKLVANLKPPKTMTKEATIEKWRETAAAKAVSDTSFDPALGRILSIGFGKNEDDPTCLYAKTEADEKGIIEAFFDDAIDERHSQIISAHYAQFDISFITRRAIVLGCRLPDRQSWPRDVTPWH